MSPINKLKPPLNQGKKFGIKEEMIEVPHYDYPIFCFKHLHRNHNLDKCDSEEKKALIEKVVVLSQMSWQQIQQAPRHGLGSEKIAISSIKPKCPPFITDDVKFLLSVRFQGKKPFLGHKDRFIFHVIFIDRDFTVYSH
mgnify:CR=1 FL=1